MFKTAFKTVILFVFLTALFAVLRLVFIGVYADTIGLQGVADVLAVMRHGIAMDFSIAGYLCVIPSLLFVAQLWCKSKALRTALSVYCAITGFIISVIYIVDLVLYGYWGFRLDMTPVFYLVSSPSAAMASATPMEVIIGVAGCALLTYSIWRALDMLTNRVLPIEAGHSIGATTVGVITTGLLFIPIRGSLTVSTMNPSRAYFSQNTALNHSAVNPIFSLLYSATHQAKYDKLYEYFPEDMAASLVGRLNAGLFMTADSLAGESGISPQVSLRTPDPDVYIIILESFSSHLMPAAGGHPVALGLDSIAREGILFPNIYASSFRTDRALPAILSALPGQPSTSVLKYIDKIEHLPSMPRALKESGYILDYYYGGDINFTNMNAYLVSLGFENIICDKDFPVSMRTSKWGVHDHLLFERLSDDIDMTAGSRQNSEPHLRVIQTSSSHEPFEVPYCNPRFADNPRLNAFAYTDSCVTSFIRSLERSPRWDSSLIVIIPDHWGVWPEDIHVMPERHRVPLIITGGAIDITDHPDDGVYARLGQQVDIAATLLDLLGISSNEQLPFSRSLLNDSLPQYAFFSRPSEICLLTPGDTVVIDCDADRIISSSSVSANISGDSVAMAAKAYLQRLYKYLSDL